MKIEDLQVEGIHLKLDRKLMHSTKRKFAKLLDRGSDIISLNIELIKDKHSVSHTKEFIAKGHLLFKGKNITISCSSDNILKSVDSLFKKLDRSVRIRHRLQKFKRHLNIFK